MLVERIRIVEMFGEVIMLVTIVKKLELIIIEIMILIAQCFAVIAIIKPAVIVIFLIIIFLN